MTYSLSQLRLRMTRRRSGAILVIALVVTIALSSVVLMLCQEMRIESMSSGNRAAAVSADAVERGAEQYVLALVADTATPVQTLSQDQFAGVQVGDGYFWILYPQYTDSTLPQFGLVDEASKLNLNAVTSAQLMFLPEMTQDIADAIQDWWDAPTGPTSDYYAFLPEPYVCKNAPFETVEELLLVQGVTRDFLYGDGTAPPLGTAISASQSSGNTNPQLSRGFFDLFTVYSKESPNDPTGAARIDINNAGQRAALIKVLDSQLDQTRERQIISRMSVAGRPITFRNPLDFKIRACPSTVTDEDFDKLVDYLKIGSAVSPGRINVNTAPREVLQCLPGLTTAGVDTLIGQRPVPTDGSNSMAWVAKALSAGTIATLGDTITGKASQYSADILAVSGNGRAFKRVRIVVDSTQSPPQVIYRRDISDRGWPMDRQILASLRAGDGPGNTTNYSPTGGMR